tara:strand:+ start:104 stop:247 length:144 start_codon:yes stop_codon:yes gene_type:complete
MEFLKRIYYSTKERSKTPKKTKPYDYKTDLSNKVVRTNLIFTILLKE